jgi:hypothetical protein
MYLLDGIEVQVGRTTFPKSRFHLGLLRPVISGDGISRVKRGERENRRLRPSIHEPILVKRVVNTRKHELQPRRYVVGVQDVHLAIQLLLAAFHTSVGLLYSTNNRNGDARNPTTCNAPILGYYMDPHVDRSVRGGFGFNEDLRGPVEIESALVLCSFLGTNL